MANAFRVPGIAISCAVTVGCIAHLVLRFDERALALQFIGRCHAVPAWCVASSGAVFVSCPLICVCEPLWLRYCVLSYSYS